VNSDINNIDFVISINNDIKNIYTLYTNTACHSLAKYITV